MDKSRVALIKCPEYDEKLVYNAIRRGAELIGEISSFAKPSERILLKPGVIAGENPQKCVSVHPTVFKAVGRLLKEAGAKLFYGDSPGFGKCATNLERAGLKPVADELGISLADFDEGKPVSHEKALLIKRFVIANGVLASDGMVSLPKLKTHWLTRLTGAVKNQFGCIPGMLKAQYHLELPDPYDFATMLVDLNTLIRPRLYIMDGIIAMEGNGPRSGKPRKLNALLISSDPIALDSIACKLINLNPEFVPTAKPGEKAGLGTYHYDRIEVVGDDLEQFIAKDFDALRKPLMPTAGGRIRGFFRNQLCPRPIIDKAKCSGCGICIEVCPAHPKALNWGRVNAGKLPQYQYERCLRCYCCQELCPEGAITVENPPLSRFLFHA